MEKYNVKILNPLRRRNSYMSFFLPIEPKSKKTSSKEKSIIQNIFITQMKERRYKTINREIAIEIKVFTSIKNPPRIEKFVKNIIDIMHKTEYLLDVNDLTYLPFYDDNLIRYINTKYIFTPINPSIMIRIRPFKSFLSDIRFVIREIGLNNYDQDYHFKNSWDDYNDLINNRSTYIKNLSEKSYNSLLMHTILDIQKDITSRISINPYIINLIYPNTSEHSLDLEVIYHSWAKELIKNPIRIELPELPTMNNTSKPYKKLIKEQLIKYLKKQRIFKELFSPVITSVFYMPPKNRKSSYKDIDNIMLEYIMPAFNEVFKPPLTIMNVHKRKPIDEVQAIFFNSVPKSLEGSAIGYEILQLPKKFSIYEEGFVSVGFKVNDVTDSIMEYTDREIERYINENRYIEC